MPTASSTPDLLQKEVGELRQQMQSLKQQTLTALERAKKSSENEQAAMLQSYESAKLEQAATLEVAHATDREDYIIELMASAGRDMACTFLLSSKSWFMALFSLSCTDSDSLSRCFAGYC
jgi:hypothetical protein